MICTSCRSNEAYIPDPFGTRANLCEACWSRWGRQLPRSRADDTCGRAPRDRTQTGRPSNGRPVHKSLIPTT